MKTSITSAGFARITRQSLVCSIIILTACGIDFAIGITPSNGGHTYASPESAAQALAAAAEAQDRSMLKEVLGPASDDLQMSDKLQGNQELKEFANAFNTHHQIIHESKTNAILEIGANRWPFPIPLVQKNGQWAFDTESGKEEIINRRIGRDELAVLQTVRAFADAQREYASRDQDGDEILEYAQKIVSASGRKDGLFWPPDLDGTLSPLGPMVAEAQVEGYLPNTGERLEPQPFHGYYFKILTRQGENALGGKYTYVVNGNMTGGFAMVAWPANYGNSGVMTFIINQQGRVYQKDLGRSTDSIAKKMDSYDPDSSWDLSPD